MQVQYLIRTPANKTTSATIPAKILHVACIFHISICTCIATSSLYYPVNVQDIQYITVKYSTLAKNVPDDPKLQKN